MNLNLAVLFFVGFVAIAIAVPAVIINDKTMVEAGHLNDVDTEEFQLRDQPEEENDVSKRKKFCNRKCKNVKECKVVRLRCKCNGFFLNRRCKATCSSLSCQYITKCSCPTNSPG